MGPLVGIAIIGALGVMGAGILVSFEAARAHAPSAPPTPRKDPSLPPRPNFDELGLQGGSALGALAPGVAPPVGGYGALDAAANIPWARRMARAWQQDVVLERVDVDRLRPDGTADCLADPDAEVTYRFLSPGKLEEFHQKADLESRPRGEYEYRVEVKKGRAEARALMATSIPAFERVPPALRAQILATPGMGAPREGSPALPALRQILAAAASERGWVTRPYYRAYLIYIPREGWDWYVSPIAGDADIPRVRAADGRLYPFSR